MDFDVVCLKLPETNYELKRSCSIFFFKIVAWRPSWISDSKWLPGGHLGYRIAFKNNGGFTQALLICPENCKAIGQGI